MLTKKEKANLIAHLRYEVESLQADIRNPDPNEPATLTFTQATELTIGALLDLIAAIEADIPCRPSPASVEMPRKRGER